MREAIPWILLLSALATLYVMLERRRRGRLNLLDEWASVHGMAIERDVGAGALAQLEPLTLVAPVVDVERLWQGRLSLQLPPPPAGPGGVAQLHVFLASCLAGTQHRPRRMLLGVFEAPPELPQLRVLPQADHGAPDNLGFVVFPTDALPPAYQLEAFAALPRALIAAMGETLQAVGGGRSDWRIELRPGRLMVAAPERDAGDPDRMLELAGGLLGRMVAAMRPAAPLPPAPDVPPIVH